MLQYRSCSGPPSAETFGTAIGASMLEIMRKRLAANARQNLVCSTDSVKFSSTACAEVGIHAHCCSDEARTSRHDVWTSTKMFKRSLLRDWPCNQSDQPRRAGSVKLSSTACAEFGTQARCCLNEARASKHIVCTSGKCSCGRCCEIGCAISQMSR